jgi:hypothetical protein
VLKTREATRLHAPPPWFLARDEEADDELLVAQDHGLHGRSSEQASSSRRASTQDSRCSSEPEQSVAEASDSPRHAPLGDRLAGDSPDNPWASAYRATETMRSRFEVPGWFVGSACADPSADAQIPAVVRIAAAAKAAFRAEILSRGVGTEGSVCVLMGSLLGGAVGPLPQPLRRP